jgi:hypothetical protein
VGRLHAIPVDQAGDLDTAPFWQVVDQAMVRHVAVDHDRLACFHRIDDHRPILERWLEFGLQLGEQCRVGILGNAGR